MSQAMAESAAELNSRQGPAPRTRVRPYTRVAASVTQGPRTRRSLRSVPGSVTPLTTQGQRKMWQMLAAAYSSSCKSLVKAWRWVQARRQLQLASKRLCLCESISLGEKRFLAIVKVDGQHFLVGGAPGSVSMLTQLAGEREFAEVLEESRAREWLQA